LEYQFTKRELTLVDQTGYSVRLTLFGKSAEEYSADSHPVVAFRGVKVGDFGGECSIQAFVIVLLLSGGSKAVPFPP
jgi:replication factor A1